MTEEEREKLDEQKLRELVDQCRWIAAKLDADLPVPLSERVDLLLMRKLASRLGVSLDRLPTANRAPLLQSENNTSN